MVLFLDDGTFVNRCHTLVCFYWGPAQLGQPTAYLWGLYVHLFIPQGQWVLSLHWREMTGTWMCVCVCETVCVLDSRKDWLGSHHSHVIFLRRAGASSILMMLQGSLYLLSLAPPWTFPLTHSRCSQSTAKYYLISCHTVRIQGIKEIQGIQETKERKRSNCQRADIQGSLRKPFLNIVIIHPKYFML